LFRSANPWDVNAQTVKAELQALIPTLARWVYGEVWVLTDNDIRLYSKTVPTLTSTADLNDAILSMTLRSLANGYKNKLQIEARWQRDVSLFYGIYSDLDARATELLNGIWGSRTESPNALDTFWNQSSNTYWL
jgi:hypothetical protein